MFKKVRNGWATKQKYISQYATSSNRSYYCTKVQYPFLQVNSLLPSYITVPLLFIMFKLSLSVLLIYNCYNCISIHLIVPQFNKQPLIWKYFLRLIYCYPLKFLIDITKPIQNVITPLRAPSKPQLPFLHLVLYFTVPEPEAVKNIKQYDIIYPKFILSTVLLTQSYIIKFKFSLFLLCNNGTIIIQFILFSSTQTSIFHLWHFTVVDVNLDLEECNFT